jgi:HD-GYP domain-containing protein (c-di-GMP phosphodiesterase class II)
MADEEKQEPEGDAGEATDETADAVAAEATADEQAPAEPAAEEPAAEEKKPRRRRRRAAKAEAEQAHEEKEETLRKLIETVASIIDARDQSVSGHSHQVARYAVALGRELGLNAGELAMLHTAGLFHDLGKVGIPEAILHKPGPLNDAEQKLMQEHPLISESILSAVDLHPFVCQIARSSHERMDGKGYPDGLRGDEIPLPARIVLVADAFDALTSDRPYRARRPVAAALEELRSCTGSQFCPRVIAALEAIAREEPDVLAGAVADVGEAA